MLIPDADPEGPAPDKGRDDGKGKGKGKGKGSRGTRAGHGKGGCVVVRHLVPTLLGLSTIEGIESLDSGLVGFQIRAAMEKQVNLIAEGRQKMSQVVDTNLALFYSKYLAFAQHIGRLRPLFAPVEGASCESRIEKTCQSSLREAACLTGSALERLENAEAVQSEMAADSERQRRRWDQERDRASLSEGGLSSMTVQLELFNFNGEEEDQGLGVCGLLPQTEPKRGYQKELLRLRKIADDMNMSAIEADVTRGASGEEDTTKGTSRREQSNKRCPANKSGKHKRRQQTPRTQ